jgi:hypothetical protein
MVNLSQTTALRNKPLLRINDYELAVSSNYVDWILSRHPVRVLFATIMLFCFSCQDRNPEPIDQSETRFEFKLIDSLGIVSIAYPAGTDTFFTWIQRSDCGKPCEHGDYRFQSKSNQIFKESGFYWDGEPEDSVEQLTIYHPRPDTVIKESVGFNDSLVLRSRKHWL